MIDLASQRKRLEPGLSASLFEVLDHHRFVLGPEVDAVEAALADFTGAWSVVTCANGTDALVLALRALGTQPGDAVIVPAFTFAATAEAVALVGARPVFADIRADTFGIDVDSVEKHLASDELPPRIVGVIAVDLFGQPADHESLASMAALHGWWVLTDAAQSIGSEIDGRSTGQVGDLVATSFFPSKPLGCYGDGGAVLCPTADRDELLRSLRNHGAGTDRYENVRIGTNSRLDTLQAAVLLHKLQVFPAELEERQGVADRYTEAFTGTVVTPPAVLDGRSSAWAVYTVRVPRRVEVTAALDGAEIDWAVHYTRSLPDQVAYAGEATLGDLPEARQATHEVLALPMHPYLAPSDQDRVVDVVLSAARGARV